MPEALDNGSQPYSCPLGDCEPCLYGRRHGQLLSLAYQQGALCDAAGIIILQFGIPILFHSTMSFLCWALQMPVLDTPGFQIRVNGILSNNIRILTPN